MTQSLDDLFDDLMKSDSLFADKDVLRHTYAPDVLLHREAQTRELATILVEALRGQTPSNILIYGKTGTGKTAVTRYVGNELEKKSDRMNVCCSIVYINCEVLDTQYRLLTTLAQQVGANVPNTGWPTDQVFQTFKEELDKKEQVLIIILDEIDKLVKKNDDVLYNLSRINSSLNSAKVSLIGVSNDLNFTDFLDSRVKSSLSQEEIIYPPYNAEQLCDILSQRSANAYKEGVLEDGVIPLCAALAAQEHGDARRALDLLRVSGEIADREHAEKVTEAHVSEAQNKIEVDRVSEVIRTLPIQTKAILFSIVYLDMDGSKITSGDVYRVYSRVCDVINVEPITSRRVTDLLSDLDMLGIINTTVISKGRYGRTKEIVLSVNRKNVYATLTSDSMLKSLENFQTKTGYFGN